MPSLKDYLPGVPQELVTAYEHAIDIEYSAGPTGPTGSASSVTGPTGPRVTGPTGPGSTVTGPTGPTGPE